MTIETKYNIGDEVWFMYENKVLYMTIAHIEVYYSTSFNNDLEKRVVYLDEVAEYRLSEKNFSPPKKNC